MQQGPEIHFCSMSDISSSQLWQKKQEVELDLGKGLGALLSPNVTIRPAEQPAESLSTNQRAASADNPISTHSVLCPVCCGHSCTHSNTHSLQACSHTSLQGSWKGHPC